MGLAWTDALRFAPGTALRFSLRLQPALRTALVQALPAATQWLERIEGAVLTVIAVEREGCEVRANVGKDTGKDDAADLADFVTTLNPNGSYRTRVQWMAATGAQEREFDELVLMLGGERDVFLAQRAEAELRHLSRWHYGQDGSVAVSIYPNAFTSRRRQAVARVLLPTELLVGTLLPRSLD